MQGPSHVFKELTQKRERRIEEGEWEFVSDVDHESRKLVRE